MGTGAGSRGGHVIGRTRSGKPKYAPHEERSREAAQLSARAEQTGNSHDHEAAARAHLVAAVGQRQKGSAAAAEGHLAKATEHEAAAKKIRGY